LSGVIIKTDDDDDDDDDTVIVNYATCPHKVSQVSFGAYLTITASK